MMKTQWKKGSVFLFWINRIFISSSIEPRLMSSDFRTFFQNALVCTFQSCACILKKLSWLSFLAFSKNHSSETDKAMFIGQDLNLVVEVSIDITVLLGIEPRDKVLAQIMIFWNDFNYWSNFLN